MRGTCAQRSPHGKENAVMAIQAPAQAAVSVSIITVTYNCEKTIARTIESVLNQTVPCREYIIKDGASTDATLEIAQSYAAAFAEKGVDYRILSAPDGGMYEALNEAIELCTGTVIGSVNGDDYYEPIAVETVLREYEREPFDMLYGDLRVLGKRYTRIKKARLGRYLTTRDWNHPTTFITRETYAKEKYRCQSMVDDGDLYLRLRRGGYRVHTVNEVLSNFTFGEGMSTSKDFREALRRGGLKWQMYRQNGCGLLHWAESYATEIVKYFLA